MPHSARARSGASLPTARRGWWCAAPIRSGISRLPVRGRRSCQPPRGLARRTGRRPRAAVPHLGYNLCAQGGGGLVCQRVGLGAGLCRGGGDRPATASGSMPARQGFSGLAAMMRCSWTVPGMMRPPVWLGCSRCTAISGLRAVRHRLRYPDCWWLCWFDPAGCGDRRDTPGPDAGDEPDLGCKSQPGGARTRRARAERRWRGHSGQCRMSSGAVSKDNAPRK